MFADDTRVLGNIASVEDVEKMQDDLDKREYLVTSLIMPERHFHFHSVVADRLQDHPVVWPQQI